METRGEAGGSPADSGLPGADGIAGGPGPAAGRGQRGHHHLPRARQGARRGHVHVRRLLPGPARRGLQGHHPDILLRRGLLHHRRQHGHQRQVPGRGGALLHHGRLLLAPAGGAQLLAHRGDEDDHHRLPHLRLRHQDAGQARGRRLRHLLQRLLLPGHERGHHPANVPNVVAAVNQTAGQVITYDGTPIVAAYSSCCGGFTATAKEVWGGTLPLLAGCLRRRLRRILQPRPGGLHEAGPISRPSSTPATTWPWASCTAS